jgi:hypothetical protein
LIVQPKPNTLGTNSFSRGSLLWLVTRALRPSPQPGGYTYDESDSEQRTERATEQAVTKHVRPERGSVVCSLQHAHVVSKLGTQRPQLRPFPNQFLIRWGSGLATRAEGHDRGLDLGLRLQSLSLIAFR